MTRPTKGHINPGRARVQVERLKIEKYEPAKSDYQGAVGETIPDLMRQMGLADRYWEQALIREWDSLVGKQVAKHARPGRVQRSTLFVFVSNSAWLNELLRYGQKQMLENLQKRFGADRIKTIRLQMDPEKR